MFKAILKEFKLIINLTPAFKKRFLPLLTIIFVFELLKILPPFFFKVIIDNIVESNLVSGTFELVALFILGYVLALLILNIIEIYGFRFFLRAVDLAEKELLEKLFGKLLRLDTNYHEENETGKSVNKLSKGMANIIEIGFSSYERLIPLIFQTIITIALFFYLNILLGLCVLLLFPLFTWVLFRNANKTNYYRRKYYDIYDDCIASISQALSNVRTVKDFANEKHEEEKAEKIFKKYRYYHGLREKVGVRSLFYEGLLINLARGMILLLSVWLYSQGNLSAGSLVLTMVLGEKAFINLSSLSRIYYRIQDTKPSIDRFYSILDAPIGVKDEGNPSLKIQKGNISFEKATFAYKEQETLKDINFEIPAKSSIALVGRSGAGKSTLVKLLLRHFDVSSGTVKIDGHDIRDYSFENLKSEIAIVSQDVELFNLSILDNIRYGNPQASKEEVIKAAKLANAHKFITELEEGYESLIGERGIKLSGGQKQRLAIARALLKKPKIIIFDEATSSLDSESEVLIHKSLMKLFGNVTLIIIAHRFSTISHVDSIVVMDNGKVKEVGTHEELLKKKGVFARLRKLQELGELSE
jgi:subfamily B ATP-binding cassette protein MsbA